jgi:hypothetical protein
MYLLLEDMSLFCDLYQSTWASPYLGLPEAPWYYVGLLWEISETVRVECPCSEQSRIWAEGHVKLHFSDLTPEANQMVGLGQRRARARKGLRVSVRELRTQNVNYLRYVRNDYVLE